MKQPPVDPDLLERNTRLTKGPKFTGWLHGEFFIAGTSAKRISAWIWLDIKRRSQVAEQ